jgi:3D (Asp-Asp-Asp) domain-containing protein
VAACRDRAVRLPQVKGYRLVRSLLSAALVLGVVALLSLVSALPAFADDDDLQAGQSVVVTGTEGRGLRMRAGPGMAHSIVTTLSEGATVQVVSGPVSDGDEDWYQISGGAAKTGWGIGRYLAPAGAVKAMSVDDSGKRTFLAKVTAYTDGIGGVPMGARTYSGTKTRWGVVAVDPKTIPIGSALTIDGYDDTIFVAEDVGGSIKGDALDIWLPDQKDAKTYGTQYRRVTIVREGPAK